MPSVARVREHVSLVLLNLLALGGALLFVRDPRATAVRVVAAPTPSPVPSATPALLHVYVTGAVVVSQVVRLAEGARAADAVAACGGLTGEADPTNVNLAAPLADGQHLHVPKVDEPPRPIDGGSPVGAAGGATTTDGSGAGGTGMSGSSGGADASGVAGAAVNVNTATASELEALPGVGPALASRIVAYRDAHGLYASVDDLLAVSGIGAKTLDRFRGRVTVR